ncbi:helix-turn-helix domain-containing protein [Niastella caeni]|nr:AraC family transcriptional regulator [Niastella caeni]
MRLSPSDLEMLQKVKDLLEKDYKYRYTQAQLANRFYINESKLRKGFICVYQIPIYEYQVSIRIAKAKELLAGTDESVKCIAYHVGYDVKSLEKQFKKTTGMSPLEWRKKNSSMHSTNITT